MPSLSSVLSPSKSPVHSASKDAATERRALPRTESLRVTANEAPSSKRERPAPLLRLKGSLQMPQQHHCWVELHRKDLLKPRRHRDSN
jgi:hypothetical protein